MKHLEESAELYALGMLDEVESEAVLAHAGSCSDCERALEQARQVVASLSEPVPQHEPRPALRDRLLASGAGAAETRSRWRWFGSGLSAGLAAAVLVLLFGHFTFQKGPSNDELALTTIVQSHFNHVSFVPLRHGAPQAKALYAKHLEWMYIVVHNPPRDLEIIARNGAGSRVLGTLSASGENGTLFVRSPGPVKEVDLVDHGITLAHATPAI